MAWPKLVGAALEYLERFTGGLVAVSESLVTAGLAVVEVVPGDAERITLLIVNVGTQVVSIAPFESVSLTRGILLSPNGGSVNANLFQDGLLPTLRWVAISGAVGQPLYVLSTRRDVRAPQAQG